MSNEPERDAVRQERQRLEELMAEYNAILDEEPVLVSARERLQEIQDECLAILARHPAPAEGQPPLSTAMLPPSVTERVANDHWRPTST